MLNRNIETFLCCDAEFDAADIVLYGAPFDSTTSFRPGTRFGSGAIRRESYGLESYSPYQDKDLLESSVMDSGDIELCMGSSESALADIQQRAETILEAGKLPFMLGGEHLVTLGAVRAVAQRFPDLHIVHFDAHADLRDDYLGVQLSHACVLHRCWELVGDGRIFQFGIRSGDREEWRWGRDHVTCHPFDLEGLEDVVDRNMQFYIQRLKENGGDIWDVFDRILDNSLHQIVSEGFLDIFRNLIKSAQFSECLQKKTEQEKEFNAASQQSFDQMYQHLDHESCPVSKEEFYDLMDLQIMLQMMALKSLLQDGQPKETVEKRYKARVRILRYGVGNGKQAERD